ncbi:MAG: asparagine synthase (glutamine-hydrolyzing), partial [Alphaproteobacteria bacterium]|nr:asparagine synthase (glutamine-hydrolyzing) [Alphaproteobacteria bacterium]
MCGIVGIVSSRRSNQLGAIVDRMNASIVHRGPDDSGTWTNNSVAIGMRRLSIVDIAGGHQPMMTDDGVVIVFNGEIYNFRALRAELIERGYRFRTSSDTEVVMNLYHAEGLDGLKRLNGMFGICLVDRRNDTLMLIRDHAGMKPLYVAMIDGEFIYASEIKAALQALERTPPINAQAINDFLTLRYVPPPQTVWQGIDKLPAGHRLTLCLKTMTYRTEPWWEPDFTPEPVEPGRSYEREFEALFLEAVESHFVTSDVPVGAFLSGGLDSSAIVAAAAEIGLREIHTFSIAGEDAGADDELPDARLVAERFGTLHHEIVLTKARFDAIMDDCLRQMDEPYADATCIPMFVLAEAARQHVKVAMSGEGADETLCGYVDARSVTGPAGMASYIARLPRPLIRLAARAFRGPKQTILESLAQYGIRGYARGRAQTMAS